MIQEFRAFFPPFPFGVESMRVIEDFCAFFFLSALSFFFFSFPFGVESIRVISTSGMQVTCFLRSVYFLHKSYITRVTCVKTTSVCAYSKQLRANVLTARARGVCFVLLCCLCMFGFVLIYARLKKKKKKEKQNKPIAEQLKDVH